VGASSCIYPLTKKGQLATAGGARRTFERHWTPVHLDFVSDVDARSRRRSRRARRSRTAEDTASDASPCSLIRSDTASHPSFSEAGDAIATPG
jgi:hypothetical protein